MNPTLLDELPHDLTALSDDELLELAAQMTEFQADDRRMNQLTYYKPVNAVAAQVHSSLKRTIGVFGGNGSSKTETNLAEVVIRCTGIIPDALKATYPREKIRGPIQARIVCESLTSVLVPIMLPKVQWWNWSGLLPQGGDKGHWGWIPPYCLRGGDWKHAFNVKDRLLYLTFRDPDDPERVLGESRLQFMSYDQDPKDFASGDIHICMLDEPPPFAIFRECRARVMRVDGTILIGMTWPDDPAIAVDWLFDEIYEKAQKGSAAFDEDIQVIELDTQWNPHLNQESIAKRAAQMSETERATRIHGRPIRLSNRVHPLFTDTELHWCWHCREVALYDDDHRCLACKGDVQAFCHVTPLIANPLNPVIFALDPHPRKPHCMLWVEIDPNDDLRDIAELEVDGAPEAVKEQVDEIERLYGWGHIRRLIDPNMGRSLSSAKRDKTWSEAFEDVGIVCDEADDGEVGRKHVDTYLKPDERMLRPRWLTDPRCVKTIHQMKRYLWDDFRKSMERDVKQVPKDKHSDFPTLKKYIANSGPSYLELRSLGRVYDHPGKRGTCGY